VIEQGYITESVSKKNNLNMIADLGSAAVLGFVLGPMFGLLATQMKFSIGPITVDPYNACGYLQVVFSLIMLAGSIFLFKEIPRSHRINYIPKG
jgi:hypothetical protein